MARNKSDYISSFGTAFEIWKALVEAVFSLGGDDSDVRRVLTDRKLRKEIATLIVRVKECGLDLRAFFQNRAGLWVSDDFHSRVLSKVEPNVKIPTFKSIVLKRDMSDAQIEGELLNGHFFRETEVAVLVSDLISKQEGGKEGQLLNNGYANLFYTGSCVVSVDWDADSRQWDVYTWERGGYRWVAGFRVFSPGN